MPMNQENDRDNHISPQSGDGFAVAEGASSSILSSYGWIALYGWAAMMSVIAALSLWPQGVVSDAHHLDKIGHFVAYAALAFVPGLFAKSTRRAIFIALVICIIGIGLEGAQALLPARVPSLLDLAANVTGGIFGTLAGVIARPYLKSRIDQFLR